MNSPAASRATPRFTVVTPSFNMLSYLRRCVASVADQRQPVEHIVVDGLSSDGTGDWLRGQAHLRSVVERDSGMYDAVNKGLARARGEFVSYLNCDEQYLPGALDKVAAHFDAHPEIDVIFGNVLLVDPQGNLLAYRKGFQPRWPYIAVGHLYVLSCTMFLRRRLIDAGARFDVRWKDVGDAEFVIRILREGARASHLGEYIAAFTMTGANMSTGPNARNETRRLRRSCPPLVRAFALPIDLLRRIEKFARGAYFQRFPLRYSVYCGSDLSARREVTALSSSARWPA